MKSKKNRVGRPTKKDKVQVWAFTITGSAKKQALQLLPKKNYDEKFREVIKEIVTNIQSI